MTLKLETTHGVAANFHKEIFKNKISETNCNSTLIALFALIVSEMDNKIGTSKKHLNVIILTNQMKIAFS